MIYYYQTDPPLCSGGPPSRTRFTLPTARERHLSMPETGEKERDYLFKELYKLKSNDLISSLRSQSLQNTHKHTILPSPSAQSRVPYIRKRNRSLWSPKDPRFFSAQATQSQKEAAWLPCLGLNPSANLPLLHHFKFLPQLARAASIFPALLGCHSKSRQVQSCGVEPIISRLLCRCCNQRELPPSYIMSGSHSHPPGSKHGQAI